MMTREEMEKAADDLVASGWWVRQPTNDGSIHVVPSRAWQELAAKGRHANLPPHNWPEGR